MNKNDLIQKLSEHSGLDKNTSAKAVDGVFELIAAALKAAGSAIDRLVQVRVYVTDIGSWPAFNTIYATRIGTSRPARAVVPVPQLHYGFKIEIEAVALEGSS